MSLLVILVFFGCTATKPSIESLQNEIYRELSGFQIKQPIPVKSERKIGTFRIISDPNFRLPTVERLQEIGGNEIWLDLNIYTQIFPLAEIGHIQVTESPPTVAFTFRNTPKEPFLFYVKKSPFEPAHHEDIKNLTFPNNLQFNKFSVEEGFIGTKPSLRFLNKEGKEVFKFIDSEPFYKILKNLNSDPDTYEYFFEVSSPTHPAIRYKFDLNSRSISVFEDPRKNNLLFPKLNSYQIEATSNDLTRVPLSVIEMSSDSKSSSATILFGYGSYGIQTDAKFNEHWLPLISRGVKLAYCHVRGGGDLGKDWHKAGMGINKLKSVEDFLSCANQLKISKISNKIIAYGVSAGGALVASALNQNPSIFTAAILKYPFLNVYETLKDPFATLSEKDRLDWGNPENSAIRNYLITYDPVLGIKAQLYPPILLIRAMYDQLIPVSDSENWLFNMKEKNPASQVTLRLIEDADHFGPKENYRVKEEYAYESSFILKTIIQ